MQIEVDKKEGVKVWKMVGGTIPIAYSARRVYIYFGSRYAGMLASGEFYVAGDDFTVDYRGLRNGEVTIRVL